jgi:dimethylhistidine N-methyltransferase
MPAPSPEKIDQSRLRLDYLLDNKAILEASSRDVVFGLTQSPKALPAYYFYDRKGSELFEAICRLPEYYPTRMEGAILAKYAEEIAQITGKVELIELGSGSSLKTRLLLDAYQQIDRSLTYMPIDVSGSILKDSALDLLADYRNLKILGKVATYQQALQQLPSSSKLVLFLGSSIGNFNPEECDLFIDLLADSLNVGDYFLLGIDLQKPKAILEAAYNDSQGITAEFNLNMLQHLNWRFQGNFDLDLFKHRAIYNPESCQIEMYLISQQVQEVKLEILDLQVEFAKEEPILTEISRKFDLQQMTAYLEEKNLNSIATYTDSRQWFGLLLYQKRAADEGRYFSS